MWKTGVLLAGVLGMGLCLSAPPAAAQNVYDMQGEETPAEQVEVLYGDDAIRAMGGDPAAKRSGTTAETSAGDFAARGKETASASAAPADGKGKVASRKGKAAKISQAPKAESGALAAAQAAFHASRVRLVWPVVPRAVRYELVLLRDAEDVAANVVSRQDYIYTNGVELDLTPFGAQAGRLYFAVHPLDHDGHAVAGSTQPQPVALGTPDPTAPLPTTQFEQMDYAPLYPVFSWIPTLGAKHHAIEIYRERGGEKKLIRTLQGGEYDVYEEGGYTVPGRYDWRVRAVDEAGQPLSDWSDFSSFDVTAPTPIAALGDSITHGGGAMTVPPGYLIYDWETYSSVPVKNLGYSGDTTAALLDRFERDVLPFSPRVLVIMGGVNDYRGSTYGSETVAHLEALRAKCDMYGIIPVFATVTPINPELILRYGQIEAPPADWKIHRDYINHWIMEQPYAVDVASALEDGRGWLDARYTTDGLHPDGFGKYEIGARIGSYLAAHFAWVTDGLVKKPVPPALQQIASASLP